MRPAARRPAARLAAACLALSALAVTSRAAAQSDADRATARSLGGEGQQALDAKDYKTAEDRFRRAESLVNAPTLLLGLARALAGEGKVVEAQETYNRIIREGVAPGAPEPFKRALADAKREVDAVSSKIGAVVITVRTAEGAEVPGAKVVLDGAPISAASLGVRRSIDPGAHVVQVTAEGFKPAEARFDVAEAGSASAAVVLEPEASAATGRPGAAGAAPGSAAPSGADQGAASAASTAGGPAPSHGARGALPWVAFGVGVVGLATGAITGLLAMGKHSDIANQCQSGTCDYPGAQGDIDAYHTIATVSTIGFVAGGVGVAAGVVLLVTQPKTETAGPARPARTGLRIAPAVGLGSIGAVGQFD
ncbi:MAG TPA: PEGA domain-containing protein [Polyangiaceae bacterium]|nr:PEGA domain-containing protein [Polyangiaceae bacterium]